MNGIRMCDVDGCASPASWAPKICVPPVGAPAAAPLQAIPGVVFCERHMSEPNPDEWLMSNGGQMRNTFMLMANGRLRPDFPRAYMRRISINSPEWGAIEREIASQSGSVRH